MSDLSLYLHIPFCVRRCGYCDFNTYAGMGHLIPQYVNAISSEIEFYRSPGQVESRTSVSTVYFGGGTPSLLFPEHYEQIFKKIRGVFDLDPECEITIEANPGQLSRELITALFSLGVNRISLGVQTTIQGELRALDRLHGYQEAVEAVDSCRQAGFTNISMDLIYGIPHQTLDSWRMSLTNILDLNPEHLSLYSLTVEEGTPLFYAVDAGQVVVPSDDAAADMYDLARDVLAQKGYDHYEISNWALSSPDGQYVSRHNRRYWRNQAYIGLGAGAHGFYRQTRYANIPGLLPYISRLNPEIQDDLSFPPAAETVTEIDQYREMQETMMMGLRLLHEGLSAERFNNRFDRQLSDVFGKEISELEQKGLIEWVGDQERVLRLTERGYLLGNQVFSAFV